MGAVMLSFILTSGQSLYQEKNITDKVIDALGSPDVLNKIIPILS
jgi:hypothetical protein